MHNRPSRSHGLDVASTRTRSCELIVKLHWRTIPRLVKPKVDRDRTTLGLAHDRTERVWHVRYLRDRLQEDGHAVVDDDKERGRYLDGLCHSGCFLEC